MSSNDDSRYRKIHPIYQAIDAQNYKGAIKLCQRKDIMKWDITKALLAYSLIMLGKNDEGLEIAHEVKTNKPTDEGVLSALSLTFKHAKCDQDCIECYENAYSVQPNNLNFASELFGNYAKIGEFKKMQQLSQKLYKNTSDPKYIFWTVSSMLHQLDSLPVTMLDLGEKMIMKILDDKTISKGLQVPGAEEIKLLIEILRKRATHPSTPITMKTTLLERSLDLIHDLSSRPVSAPIDDNNVFIKDPSIVKSHPTHIKLLSIDILKELHNAYSLTADDNESTSLEEKISRIIEANQRVLVILKGVIDELPDQWDALDSFVNFHLDSYRRNKLLGNDTSSSLGQLHETILQMQSISILNRGPFLAEMLLLQKWTEEKSLETGTDSPSLPEIWNININNNNNNTNNNTNNNIDNITEILQLLNLNDSNSSRSMQNEMTLLLIKYIIRFESKQCCYTDIKPYLSSLHLNSSLQLQSWINSRIIPLQSNLLSLANYESNTESKDDLTKDVPENLCRLSKLLQIQYFIKLQHNINESYEEQLNFIRTLVTLYCVTHSIAAGKGVGGLREVQPGDELLMLASTVVRNQIQQLSTLNYDKNESNQYEEKLLNLNLNWLTLLEIGRQMSPHSYCFTVELLEPLRYLSCTKYALELYNTLGVRYIQLDSMSYLILPLLIEGGYTTEMLKLSKNIVGFHESARRDTLASVAKSFTYCNYAKGIELGEFCQRCQKSTQLALSKSELPLFQIIEKLHTSDAVYNYLQGYIAHMHLESQDELNENQLKELVDNMDYDLLPRVEYLPNSQVNLIRRSQYEIRIKKSQSFLRLIVSILQNDFINATSKINEFWLKWCNGSELVSANNPFGTLISQDEKISTSNSQNLFTFWSQQINSGIVHDSSLESLYFDTILCLCSSSVIINQLTQLNKDSPETEETQSSSSNQLLLLRQNLETISQQIHVNLNKIREILHLTVNDNSNKKFYQNVTPSNILVNTSWIRQVSLFCQIFGNWSPILLSHIQNNLLKDSPKKKKGKKTSKSSSNDTEEGRLIISLIQDCKQLIESVESALDHNNQKPQSSTVTEFSTYIRSTTQSFSLEDNHPHQVSEALNQSSQSLANHILSSQELTRTRLRDLLRNKKQLLAIS